MAVNALYRNLRDGLNSQVSLSLDPQGLRLTWFGAPGLWGGGTGHTTLWPYSSLFVVAVLVGGGLNIGTHDDNKIQLSISDPIFVKVLQEHAPRLQRAQPQKFLKFSTLFFGGSAILAVLFYVTLNFMPDVLVPIFPKSWMEKMTSSVQAQMVKNYRRCHNPKVEAVFGTMLSQLAEGNANLPPVTIEVYDLPVTNAFTLSGGHLLFTSKLIQEASGPDEIAGILAHELGHAHHKHPETSLIRVMGADILLSGISGGWGSSSGVSIGTMAALLTYSRQAENEADDYARQILVAARIDPQGARHFFERAQIREQKNKSHSKILSEIDGLFATHPGTEERLERFGPLPDGVKPVQLLDVISWKAFKQACPATAAKQE